MSETIKNLYKVEATISSSDFIGFTFNGRHSSSLGIVRTSDGSRFNENLLPTMQDKTLQVPGGDGTYYFGSYYTQRTFNVPFAFDGLTELQLAELKRWLGDKQIHELIFDEAPYKAYQAKVTGSATIKHIPFGEVGERIYKGEGSIQFTAYYPYAKCSRKFLSEYDNDNKAEWKDASGLKPDSVYSAVEIEGESVPIYYDGFYNNLIHIYNPGDIETHFQLILKFDVQGTIPKFGILLYEYQDRQLRFGAMARQGEDAYVRIDTKLNLVEGLDINGKKTGNIYNKYMIAGQFFKIPRSRESLTLEFNELLEGTSLDECKPKIAYDFYYI